MRRWKPRHLHHAGRDADDDHGRRRRTVGLRACRRRRGPGHRDGTRAASGNHVGVRVTWRTGRRAAAGDSAPDIMDASTGRCSSPSPATSSGCSASGSDCAGRPARGRPDWTATAGGRFLGPAAAHPGVAGVHSGRGPAPADSGLRGAPTLVAAGHPQSMAAGYAQRVLGWPHPQLRQITPTVYQVRRPGPSRRLRRPHSGASASIRLGDVGAIGRQLRSRYAEACLAGSADDRG
jgi:hypothetical protein